MLAEWHVTPDYVINNWTEELLSLMCEKLSERKEREREASRGYSTKPNKVSDKTFFAQARNLIKVVKRGD